MVGANIVVVLGTTAAHLGKPKLKESGGQVRKVVLREANARVPQGCGNGACFALADMAPLALEPNANGGEPERYCCQRHPNGDGVAHDVEACGDGCVVLFGSRM